jgi:hypothetical protein
MPLDSILVPFALLNAAVLVFTGLRAGRAMRDWVFAGLLLAAVTGAGWLLVPGHAGLVALGAWAVLAGVPLAVRMAYVRASQRRDWRAGLRAARLLALLHPSRSARAEVLRTRAQLLSERGDEAGATALLARAAQTFPPLAVRLRVESLTLPQRWPEVLAFLRAEVTQAQLRADPGLLLAWLRALGECGERAELVSFYRAHALLLGSAQAVLLRGMARLTLFAFTGRRAEVERLLSTSLSALPAPLADTWRAVTALTAGDAEAARTLLLPHRAHPSPPVRRAIEARLAQAPPDAAPVEGEAALLDAEAALLEQELRYGGPLVAGGVQRAPLTKAVALVLLAVHAAVWRAGDWDEANPLLWAGALWPPPCSRGASGGACSPSSCCTSGTCTWPSTSWGCGCSGARWSGCSAPGAWRWCSR